jgi:hypothetical protein
MIVPRDLMDSAETFNAIADIEIIRLAESRRVGYARQVSKEPHRNRFARYAYSGPGLFFFFGTARKTIRKRSRFNSPRQCLPTNFLLNVLYEHLNTRE